MQPESTLPVAPRPFRWRDLAFGAAFLTGVGLDQGTKGWVVANLEPVVDEVHLVPGWFSLVHAHNTGAAFSTFEGQLPLFLVFTAIAIVVVVDMVRRLPLEDRFVPMTLGLILSGAVGNGIDRLRMGHVTDFLKVYGGEEPLRSWLVERFGTYVWPIFNVADSALLVGVFLFGVYWLFQRDGEPQDDEEATPAAS